MTRIAVLDDWQNVARTSADWAPVLAQAPARDASAGSRREYRIDAASRLQCSGGVRGILSAHRRERAGLSRRETDPGSRCTKSLMATKGPERPVSWLIRYRGRGDSSC